MTLRVLMVGASEPGPCGVANYDAVVRRELEAAGVQTSVVWWRRDAGASRARTRRGLEEWLSATALESERFAPSVVLWHYSVFTYSYRGLPIFARRAARGLQAEGVPVVALLHEFVFEPWRALGARGALYAVTHRLALRSVLAACAAAIVTTEHRMDHLQSRPWLPRRPLGFVPVCSTVPQDELERAAREVRPANDHPVVGVFGFGTPNFQAELLVEAMRRIRRRGPAAELRLIGAPGRDSEQGRRWIRAADSGDRVPLTFSGVVEPRELLQELALCDLLVHPEPGPSSRRTTFATALALGRPSVVLADANGWHAAIEHAAIRAAPAEPAGLAAVVDELLWDPAARDALGERARRFHASSQAPRVVARQLQAALEGWVGRTG